MLNIDNEISPVTNMALLQSLQRDWRLLTQSK